MNWLESLEEEAPEPKAGESDPVKPMEPSTNVVITGVRLTFNDVFLLVLLVTFSQAIVIGFVAFVLHEVGVF